MNFQLDQWVSKNPNKTATHVLVYILHFFMKFYLSFTQIMLNAICCEKMVQGLPRLGSSASARLFDSCAECCSKLNESLPIDNIVLTGNAQEQQEFLAQYVPENLVVFLLSNNTRDQSQKVIAWAKEHGITGIQIITHEALVARTYLTMTKEAIVQDAQILILPGGHFFSKRLEFSNRLIELAVMIEAVKLRKYQKRGHIATLDEALDYQKSIRDLDSKITVICTIF